jgi:ERCC4-type nuclease
MMRFNPNKHKPNQVKPNLKRQFLKKLQPLKSFKMIIDTREQQPLPIETHCQVVHKALKDGDYSIEGYEHLFAIELKRMSDLTSYIYAEHEKTSKKKRRFKQMIDNGGFVALVIDGVEYKDILKGYQYGGLTPSHYETFLTRLKLKYGIHIFASRDSKELARWVVRHALEFYELQRELEKEGSGADE